MDIEIFKEMPNCLPIDGETWLFVFLEEEDRLAGTFRESWSDELRASGVEYAHFLNIETEFGSCDPQDISQRERRRRLLQEHFGEDAIWNILIRVARVNGKRNKRLLKFLRASSWRLYILVREPETDTFVSRESSPRELDRGDANVYGLRSVARVPEPMIERLEEVFSLNHIEDWRFDEEDGAASMQIAPPLPPSPFLTESTSEEITLDRPDFEEFESAPASDHAPASMGWNPMNKLNR